MKESKTIPIGSLAVPKDTGEREYRLRLQNEGKTLYLEFQYWSSGYRTRIFDTDETLEQSDPRDNRDTDIRYFHTDLSSLLQDEGKEIESYQPVQETELGRKDSPAGTAETEKPYTPTGFRVRFKSGALGIVCLNGDEVYLHYFPQESAGEFSGYLRLLQQQLPTLTREQAEREAVLYNQRYLSTRGSPGEPKYIIGLTKDGHVIYQGDDTPYLLITSLKAIRFLLEESIERLRAHSSGKSSTALQEREQTLNDLERLVNERKERENQASGGEK